MYTSPVKLRSPLTVNRSTSLNAIGAHSEPTSISSSINRHSSSELIVSPQTRPTGSFNPAQPRYAVNSELLLSARRSIEVGRTSPKMPQRVLPPLPTSPSTQAKSPKFTASSTPASPALHASPAHAPASPASPASRTSPSLPSASHVPLSRASHTPASASASPAASPASTTASPAPSASSPASPIPLASPRLSTSLLSRPTSAPPSPILSLSNGPESNPLSPTGASLVPRKPLPTPPVPPKKKRELPELPRDSPTPRVPENQVPQTPTAQASQVSQASYVPQTHQDPGAQTLRALKTPQALEVPNIRQAFDAPRIPQALEVPKIRQALEAPQTPQVPELHQAATPQSPLEAEHQALQDPKKDNKYYSNPEAAVTMSEREGLCQRHLSAPSSVLSETELVANAESTKPSEDFVPVKTNTEAKAGSRTRSIGGAEKPDNILRSSGELANLKSTGELTNNSILRSSGELTNPSNLRSSGELTNDSSPGSSVDPSGDQPKSPSLRSWYLKKNSIQERYKTMRREPRIHRKALPDIVEVTQKNKCIKEIFTSEASYVDDLSVAIKVFKEPMHHYKTVSDEDAATIFSNIEELYEINKALLTSLVELIPGINELAADDDPCPPIGDVFLRHLNKFSGYTTYLCSKDLSTRVVKKVENLAHFAALMKECRHECQGLGLGDFLIKPVQRLCKYPLLFKELRKYLLPSDPQLPILNEVISEIEKLTEITNRTITNTEKLGEVKKIMGGEIAPLVEGATMIRDGTVFVVTKSKKEESFFWLLDNVILWHPTKATLSRKVVAVKSSKSSATKTKGLKNTLPIDDVTALCDEEYEHHKHSFSLKYKNTSGTDKRVIFCAQSYLEKLCWIDDIKAQLAK